MSADTHQPAAPHPVDDSGILSGFHLIEADAGTGKTWTLAQLVVRAVREGRRRLPEILVVTFTKAATAELADRIRSFLQKALLDVESGAAPLASSEVSPASQAQHLRRALADIDRLQVQTIHGFCQTLLRDHSFELDLPGDFVLREDSGDELRQALGRWWRDTVVANRLGLSAGQWSDLLACGLSLARLEELLRHAASDPLLRILPQADSLGLALSGDEQADEVRMGLFLAEQTRALRDAMTDVHRQLAVHGANLSDWLLGPAKQEARKGSRLGTTFMAKRTPDYVARALRLTDPASAIDEAITKDIGRFSVTNMRRWFDDPASLRFAALHRACEQVLVVHARMRSINALMAQWLAPQILNRLHEQRRESGEIGFDGLLQEAYLLVTRHQDIAQQMRARHPMALIDESQDTDPLQWAIFEHIYQPSQSGAGWNLILVGDPKQSIYGFRGADVFAYLHAASLARHRHRLGMNRRSAPTVLTAINQAFTSEDPQWQPFLQDGIGFDEAEPDLSRDGASQFSRYQLIQLSDQFDRKMLARELAQVCARRIALLRSEQPQARACVLVNLHAEGQMVETALQALGIACMRAGRDNVWHTRWAAELQWVLEAIAEPASRMALRRARLTESLSLSAPPRQTTDGDAHAAQQALQAVQSRLLQAAQDWPLLGAQAVLARLLLSPGLARDSYLALAQMIEVLAADSAAARDPLQASLAVQQRRMQAQAKPPAGGAKPWRLVDTDAVQIMTIHQSKGLQFDTVLVPYAGIARGQGQGSRKTRKHHRHVDGQWRGVVDTLASEESLAQLELEARADQIRLFYVAVTRAEQQLILFSPAQPEAGSPLAHCGLLSACDIVHSGAALQGLAPASPAQAGAASKPSPSPEWALSEPRRMHGADWHWQSYTGLTRHAPTFGSALGLVRSEALSGAGSDAADRDQQQAEPSPLEEAAAASRAMRFRFPKGAKAGVVLHGLLEHHTFSSPLSAAALQSGLQGLGVSEVLAQADQVGQWLQEVLATPLQVLQGQGLSVLPAVQRRVELGFTLGLQDFDWPHALALVARHYPLSEHARQLIDPPLFAPRSARQHAARLSGFLKGFIDMVFEWQGRFYILDWKSNHLGDHAADYRPARLEAAIAEHDYAMQWCLYSVALLRWLRLRMPGEDPLPRIGGVVYAFLRGMMGEGSPANAGVYSTRVPDALLLALDRALGQSGGASA